MAACAVHPEAEAVGTCARCGRFHCAAEQVALDGHVYCAECAARDDVDWLGKHYAKFEGKRSGTAWVYFFAGLLLAALALTMLLSPNSMRSERGVGAALAVYSAAAIAFFTGWRRARWLLPVSGLLAGAVIGLVSEQWLAACGAGVLLSLFGLAAATDVRTMLFFRVPVGRPALRKHFDRYGSNPLAVGASRLALVSLFVPGLSLVSLVLGIIALARVDKNATPPIANVSAALAAIVFSLIVTGIYGLAIASAVFH